ncbi:transglycosylase SLT domain-containing protein [Nonomuraea sp. NPDC050383]|uniref:lytic transglycosylase domain-containing protein n=1 Tax=Nonomuraea sp. NPDC050383 TaxID=3364362 RepID=UPI0037B5826F
MRSAHVMIAAPLVVVLAGCAGVADGAAAPRPPAQSATRQAPPGATPEPAAPGTGRERGDDPPAAAGADVPAPDASIPTDPAELAAALEKTSTALYAAIDRWTRSGQERPPQDVVLLSLHQQRVYRVLARDAALARRTAERLPARLAAEARDNAKAVGSLLSLARPISAARRKQMRLTEPLPAERLRGYMTRAEKRFGVEWEVLAAVMLVETKFGRVTSSSSAGAQGPMQFMPATWGQYGLGGDVHDARDAVLGAANYLKASGAPGDYRRALFAYNHSGNYVDAVLAHARQMRRDPRSFYAYYNWQVFVLSAKGDVRLTGPR